MAVDKLQARSASHFAKPRARFRAASASVFKVSYAAALVAAVLVVCWAANGRAAPGPGQSAASRQVREEAVQSIPFDRFTQQAVRDKLWGVVSNPSIYRRMPKQTIDCDSEMFVFLVRHPEVVVNMWQLMGVTDVSLQRTSPLTFDASDGAGTTSSVELVYGAPEVHVYYAEGHYEGALLKRKLTGRCVIVLRSNYGEDDSKRPLVACEMDVFLQVDNLGIDLLARTLHPLVGRTADHNFAESASFLGAISQASEVKTDRLLDLAGRLEKVDPQIRADFTRIATAVSQRTGRGAPPQSAARPSGVSRNASPAATGRTPFRFRR